MKTVVNLLLDETGSMSPLRDTVISAVNEYVESFRNKEDMYFKLMLFNTNCFKESPLTRMRDFKVLTFADYYPDSTTPLYDSVVRSIQSLEKDLDGKKRKVLFVIYTDGLENASIEYDQKIVFKKIQEKQKEGWTFVFMGANQDAWASGVGIGILGQNTLTYDATNLGVSKSYNALRIGTQTFYDSDGSSGSNFWDSDEDGN